MSSYTKATNFASKDALASGNALKIVKGTEIDNEFNAIAVAVNSKIEGYNALLTGVPTAPTASYSAYTTQVATTAFVHDVLPRGVIMLWSGSSASIPAGWQICDGTNSTPNLRDRFVVGAGTTYAVAATGGSANAVVVSHNHTATTAANGDHQHFIASNINSGGSSITSGTTAFRQKDDAGDSNYNLVGSTTTASVGLTSTAGSHTHSVTVDSNGVSGTNANLPPYYALCYIMKTTGI